MQSLVGGGEKEEKERERKEAESDVDHIFIIATFCPARAHSEDDCEAQTGLLKEQCLPSP